MLIGYLHRNRVDHVRCSAPLPRADERETECDSDHNNPTNDATYDSRYV